MNAANTTGFTNPDVYLRYWRWFSNNKGASPGQDTMLVQISNNNGANWTTLETVSENAGAWVKKSFRVADVIAPTTTMKIRFIARDIGADSLVEAAIDDIQLRVVGCPPENAGWTGGGAAACPANCDGNADGAGAPILDVRDLVCFQTRFAAGDPDADCDRNGVLTATDLACFQAAFAAGCR